MFVSANETTLEVLSVLIGKRGTWVDTTVPDIINSFAPYGWNDIYLKINNDIQII